MLYLFPAANDVSSVMGRGRGIGRTRAQIEVKTERDTRVVPRVACGAFNDFPEF